jgi:hypothetical protein
MVKQLKSQEETKHIPVMMFSAHPIAEEPREKRVPTIFWQNPLR